ncbi:thioredoxin family protein [Gottfriedia solisilvae]|uniref:thioredoxin family protein n=1 Tax=Gottfriedia solisilvae TaxID=1516104 RepID=UPI003D2F0B66
MLKLQYKIIAFVLILVVAISTYFLTNNKVTEAKKNTYELSQKELTNRLKEKKETVVYFYRTDCEYCKKADPMIKETSKANNVKIYRLDVNKYDGIWEERNISGTPIIVWYKDGYEISRLEGLKTQDMYYRWFKALSENE